MDLFAKTHSADQLVAIINHACHEYAEGGDDVDLVSIVHDVIIETLNRRAPFGALLYGERVAEVLTLGVPGMPQSNEYGLTSAEAQQVHNLVRRIKRCFDQIPAIAS